MKFKTLAVLVALVVVLWGLTAQEPRARHVDYLDPALRERVETLKQEAGTPSADTAVLTDRLDTLWAWANAYSLTGGPIPGGFPQLTANANRGLRGLRPGGAQLPVAAVSRFIAQYSREFQIKDEMPEAIGRLTLSSGGPFLADGLASVSMTYEVGALPMAAGGGIAVGQWRSGRLQVSDPSAANYVTVRTSNPGAKFEAAEPWGAWVTFETRNVLALRLSGADLATGDTVTLTFGDRSGSGPGLRMQQLVQRPGCVQDIPGLGGEWLAADASLARDGGHRPGECPVRQRHRPLCCPARRGVRTRSPS